MCKIVVEIPEGWGVILLVKKWKFRGGAYVKFPPWWGYGYFLELHIIHFSHNSYSETEAKQFSHFVSEENTQMGLVTRQTLNLT